MDFLKVFLVGGFICLIAQIVMDKYKVQPAYILVSFVTLGVILTFIGVYDPLVNFAQSGATVPIIGFGYALAEGVRKAIDLKGAIGILTGGITGTAAGIVAAMFFGYIMALIFKSKPKP